MCMCNYSGEQRDRAEVMSPSFSRNGACGWRRAGVEIELRLSAGKAIEMAREILLSPVPKSSSDRHNQSEDAIDNLILNLVHHGHEEVNSVISNSRRSGSRAEAIFKRRFDHVRQFLLLKLTGREVHGDANVRRPGERVGAGLTQHPRAELDND